MASAYSTTSEADVYFNTLRLNSAAWTDAITSDKQKALYEATRLIDVLSFRGKKTDLDQELEFPRDGETEIPNNIVLACYEIAFSLLDGVNTEYEQDKLRIQNSGYANVRTTYDTNITDIAKRHGIPSHRAWSYLLPYLAESRSVNLRRV
jgi:protease II